MLTYGALLQNSGLLFLGQMIGGIPCVSLCFMCMAGANYKSSRPTIIVVSPIQIENPINVVPSPVKEKEEADPTNIV